MTIFFENAPILESLRDGLLLAKQVTRVEVGLVLAHLGTRRISRVRMKRMMRMRMIIILFILINEDEEDGNEDWGVDEESGLVLAHLVIRRMSRVRMKRMIRGKE